MNGMQKIEINALISEFNEQAEKVKDNLTMVLEKITGGAAPSAGEVLDCTAMLNSLTYKYDQVVMIAKESLSQEEMPENGASVAEYAEAVEKCAKNGIRRRIQEARGILEKFTRVKSQIDSYMAALVPFQKEAQGYLLMLDEAMENPTADTVIPDINGQRLFVKAVEYEDLDSEAGLDLLEKVSECYPFRICTGLTRKNYYIEEALDANGPEMVGEPKNPKMGEVVEAPDVEALQDAQSLQNIYEERAQGAVVAQQCEEQPVSEVTCSKPDEGVNEAEGLETESDFVVALKEKGVILPERQNFGIFSVDISPAEDKKITASAFISDIRKGNQRALINIIDELLKQNVLTAKLLINRFGSMPMDALILGLNHLHKKGYLRKYKLIPGGEFYCETTKLEKALGYKDASRFVGQKQFKLSNDSVHIEDKASSAAARITMAELYADSVLALSGAGIARHSICSRLLTEATVFKVYPADNVENNDLFVTVFWTDTTECDEFKQALTEMLEETEATRRLFVAGINAKQAKLMAEVLLEFGKERFENIPVYLYSLSDNCYCDFETLEQLERESVWVVEEKTEEAVMEEADAASDDVEASEEVIVPVKEEQVTIPETVKEAAIVPKTKKEISAVSKPKTVKTPEEDVTLDSRDVLQNIYKLIAGKKFYCATAYANACAHKDAKYAPLYELLAFALNDPVKHCTYSADGAFDLIPGDRDEFLDNLIVAIGMRTFFSNQVLYDYNIRPFYNGIKDYNVINDFPHLSKVIYTLMDFKDTWKKGMDAYADYRAKSQALLDVEIKSLQREAKIFYESTIAGKKTESASQRRFLETKKLIFDVSSDIGQYIKAVVDGESELQPLVVDFLKENFVREGNAVGEDTIDADMLWNYIVFFWDKAGEKMMMVRRADLMSRLRSNIVNTTTKAVQILARWCRLVDVSNNQTEDDGTLAYRKIRKPLLDNIEAAVVELEGAIGEADNILEMAAGLRVLCQTLQDIRRCISGEYDESERRYFYVPFLLTDDVLLDEAYLPDLAVHSSEMYSLQPEVRILKHAYKECASPLERLREILDEKGDDYGSAKLLADYVMKLGLEADMEKILSDISGGEEYARETAELRKEDFIGELELAQSYGQIDNSEEDKKEKILQIIDAWYEWAIDSANYGFFKKVMDEYLLEIREEAKSREKDLLEQLEAFRNTAIRDITAESKKKKIAKIQAMIEQQNYTVAEDLLAHADVPEDEHEDLIEEDFLKEFLKNYDDYYQPVATQRMNLATLVSNRTRNKEERGAKKLAENWLPGGSWLGKDKLAILLTCFGFKLDNTTIQVQTSIGKFENFFVKTVAAKGGKRENFTHPIAAFGSGTAQEGFRVVCVNGGYDADGLIDVMKQIGNAKHTMLLLDYALTLSERRRLARKSRNTLGDKLFAVVDRAVMMFLIKNYDETKINRMLISLVAPFGYYQPYVWESANVMPPEIFMGRKYELERIESPTGANIVYGGRQLGKSALLKKAKADIDRDENNDRAVLVDIKGLNYEQAAKKIGHALFDEGVLTEDITTTDWDELARAVRNRLQSNTRVIPYLLLLLDEADAFIESCAAVNYKPFDALKEIQGIGSGRFKFVIAGLRNIVRFKREALANNSVLTHLEAMTVKPFKPTEARELMEVPLHYLGLRFPKEKEYLITLILASTNYFPGLIQLYCAKLLEAMRNKDYAGYDEKDAPVYEVSEEHIKKVLADPDFMQQIREKYIITLKLDEDNYYYLIALIMAYLYHSNGYSEGYSAEDIKTAGNDLGIAKIGQLDDIKLYTFMEELKELNVLRNTDDKHYLFTRFTFFQMMGTRSEVDDKLEEYMEG